MRERNIAIAPQAAITKDNVSVEVSGNLYVQFTDAEKVQAYGICIYVCIYASMYLPRYLGVHRSNGSGVFLGGRVTIVQLQYASTVSKCVFGGIDVWLFLSDCCC